MVARDKDGVMVGFMRPAGWESNLKGHVCSKWLDDRDQTSAPRFPDGQRGRVASSTGNPFELSRWRGGPTLVREAKGQAR